MWESRVLQRAFERLELHEGKLSRAVLRGGGGGDVTSLPDAGVGNHPGLPGPGYSTTREEVPSVPCGWPESWNGCKPGWFRMLRRVGDGFRFSSLKTGPDAGTTISLAYSRRGLASLRPAREFLYLMVSLFLLHGIVCLHESQPTGRRHQTELGRGMGIRGGAVSHIRRTSSRVRP